MIRGSAAMAVVVMGKPRASGDDPCSLCLYVYAAG